MEKIKQFLISGRGKSIFLAGIIILASTGSFLLGRLSKDSSSGIKIEYSKAISENTNLSTAEAAHPVTVTEKNSPIKSIITTSQSQNGNKTFFASNRGSKYYPSGCSAGKTIKMENRVYFSTSAAAVAAGYTLSSSCK